MASEVKTNKISPATSTTVTLGDASDVFQLPASAEIDIASGATLDVNGTIDVTGATVTGLTTGIILQIVYSSFTDEVSTTSGSYVDTGLTATITPVSASNKVLVLCDTMTANVAGSTFVNILRDSTTLISQSAGSTMDTNNAWATGGGANWTGADRVRNNPSLVYLDSPSTTSATVYKMQFLVDSSTGYINRWGLSAALGGVSTLCLMEVAA
jgi:hypothetical protein